jgi:hypothetical protein
MIDWESPCILVTWVVDGLAAVVSPVAHSVELLGAVGAVRSSEVCAIIKLVPLRLIEFQFTHTMQGVG